MDRFIKMEIISIYKTCLVEDFEDYMRCSAHLRGYLRALSSARIISYTSRKKNEDYFEKKFYKYRGYIEI